MQTFIQTKYNLSSELLASLLSCAYLTVMIYFVQTLPGSGMQIFDSAIFAEWMRMLTDSMSSLNAASCEQNQCHAQNWLILVAGLISSHFYWALAFKD